LSKESLNSDDQQRYLYQQNHPSHEITENKTEHDI